MLSRYRWGLSPGAAGALSAASAEGEGLEGSEGGFLCAECCQLARGYWPSSSSVNSGKGCLLIFV